MNIAKILKYCPKGTKLYSLVEGDVIIDKKGSIFLISRILDVGGSTLEMAAVLNKEGLTINPNVWQSPYGKSIASEEDRNRLFSALAKKGYIYMTKNNL